MPVDIAPDDLSEFPGAPFTQAVVDAALGNLRSATGWHVALSRTETLTLDSDGGRRVVLPTLNLTAVTAVRNIASDTPTTLTDFRWSKAGVLALTSGCWPEGFQTLEVDVTHGFETFPPELLAIVAAECQQVALGRLVASRSAGPFSESYRDAGTVSALASDPVVQRYTLPSRL